MIAPSPGSSGTTQKENVMFKTNEGTVDRALRIRMRRPCPINFALAGCRGGVKRSVAGSSSGTTRRDPYESLARCA